MYALPALMWALAVGAHRVPRLLVPHRSTTTTTSGTTSSIWCNNSTASSNSSAWWVEHYANSDLLPFTKEVQQDIWAWQHPKTCQNRTFLVLTWLMGVGIGAALHSVAACLQQAIEQEAILVTGIKRDFEPSQHNMCRAHYGRLDCYFEPLTSGACMENAAKAGKSHLLHCNPLSPIEKFKNSGNAVRMYRWATPTTKVNILRTVESIPRKQLKFSRSETPFEAWWQAQAVRYMLRQPSQHLCDLYRRTFLGVYHPSSISATTLASNNMKTQAVQPLLLESSVWTRAAPKRLRGAAFYGGGMARPFPLIGMHVRHGDKGMEMKLFNLEQHLAIARRIKAFNPAANSIFLSTEDEFVIGNCSEAAAKEGWQFFFTKTKRVKGLLNERVVIGRQTTSENAFVNLLMGVEAEYFVGTLASNWNRLINELRQTSGKLHGGYITLN